MANDRTKLKLLRSEDYWAIWLGAFFLVLGVFIYLVLAHRTVRKELLDNELALSQQRRDVPFKTVDWYEAEDRRSRITGANTEIGRVISMLLRKPTSWRDNPLNSLFVKDSEVSEADDTKLGILRDELAILKTNAIISEQQARDASFQNTRLNNAAVKSTEAWRQKHLEMLDFEKGILKEGFFILPGLIFMGAVLSLIFGLGASYMGKGYHKFIKAFLGVFLLAVCAFLLAAQADMRSLGISYAVWAIVIGLVISNTVGTPEWMKPAVQTEYFIKTGLVLLGAEILLGKIMAIGLPGIFVSWVVTPLVLVITFWFGQRILKIGSKTLNITISADMSVCGVSAAIATAAACNAKKEELTLAVGLSMVFTSIMMIAMPAFINAVGIHEILGGAWIGGTIDATGAVVAAGAFLGDRALNVAATIKMIQNVLIGLIAFGVAVYWAARVERTGQARVGVSEIWTRFPKFVIGFMGASIVFSILYAVLPERSSWALIDHGLIGGFTKDLRGWLFCLAFVSIGLSVNFKELKHHFSGGKPLILYVCGQGLNLALTLLMAYLMFYLAFPEITNKI